MGCCANAEPPTPDNTRKALVSITDLLKWLENSYEATSS